MGKIKTFRKRKTKRYSSKLFIILTEFAKLKKKTPQEMTLIIVEHLIQEITASPCGIFQIYFYKNLFDADEKSTQK